MGSRFNERLSGDLNNFALPVFSVREL